MKRMTVGAALAGVIGCASPEPTAPVAAAPSRFATVEGVQLAATLSPSVVARGDSTVVTLSLTNPSGSEITVGLAGSGYGAFVIRIGHVEAIVPVNRGVGTGYIWAGVADPEVPIPARASIVEAIGAVHVGTAVPARSTAATYALEPGHYLVRACVVQPAAVERCAPPESLTVVR
jgi:hypothetical protein